jgi:hypothetical protein
MWFQDDDPDIEDAPYKLDHLHTYRVTVLPEDSADIWRVVLCSIEGPNLRNLLLHINCPVSTDIFPNFTRISGSSLRYLSLVYTSLETEDIWAVLCAVPESMHRLL